ncbi:hypothetical protein MPSEU_000489400 [Mayamaea pseudoterrestris]|nr:hypothetical protein MPSEU_000489400 [Mayamaea pseudoterrestris]
MRTAVHGSVRRPLRHSVSSAVPDETIVGLYTADEYYTTANGLYSPKSLANLALNTLCKNLTLYHDELPHGIPQEVVDDIVNSLIGHSALNATTLHALRNCELHSLNLAHCRLVTDEWLRNWNTPNGSHHSSPAVQSASPVNEMEIEDLVLESPKLSIEESSQNSDTSFVSAYEDHPMEDTQPPCELQSKVNGWQTSAASNLAVLDLRGSQHLTDHGLLQLTGLNCLKEVRLGSCHSLVGHGLLVCSSSMSLHTVSLFNCRRLTDEAVISISHLLSLENLFLGGCRCLTDRSMKAIEDLCSLRRLDISRCDLITDEGLESLENLSALEELSLGWCRRITDAGMDYFTRQPHRERNLRVLNVARCAITNTGVEFIGRLQALEQLDMNGCNNISSSALATTVGRLMHLTNLNASYCPGILRARFQGRVESLKVLDLRYSAVSNAHLLRFTTLPALEELNLDSCDVGDVAITYLADNDVCPNLLSLDMADCNDLTDAGMAKIAKFRKLVRLSLFCCNITDAGLGHLSQLTDLEVLNLDCRLVTDDGLLPLRNLEKLKCLDVFAGRITDIGCGHLANITSLESLELCGGGVGDFGCRELAKLDKLETLNLAQNNRITNRGAVALGALTKLKTLNLSNTRITSTALSFFSGLVQLQSLAIYGCRGIDNSRHLVTLQNELPNLKCLRVDSADEHDGTFLAGESDVDSDSTWSESGGLMVRSGSGTMIIGDDDVDDFD